MEVVYNGLIDDDRDDALNDNYTEINNDDVLTLILEFPHFIKNNFIRNRLKHMITIK